MFKRTFPNDLVALGILIILVVSFFFDVLFLNNVFCFRDIYRYFYPYKLYATESIKDGKIPLWNPYISSGIPFIATLQSQVFYPLSVIHYILPFNFGFQLFIVIHFFLAGIFIYILCKELKLQPISSLTSAVIFSFSGYLVSVVDMVSSLSSVIWLPLVFLYFHKTLFERSIYKKVLYILILSILIGIEFLGGEPTILYGTVVLLIIYNIIFIKQKNSIYILPIAGIISFLLVAFQLLPFLELLGYSDRINLPEKIGYYGNLFWSLPPEHIFNFFIPMIFGDITKRYIDLSDISQLWLKSFYVGIIPLVLAFYTLLSVRKDNNKNKVKIIYFFIGVFILSVFLSSGSYNFLYKVFYYLLPGLKLIRYPVKFLFLSTFAISIISGFGLEYILSKKDKVSLIKLKKIVILILIALGLLLTILFLFKEPFLIFYKKNFFPDMKFSDVIRLLEKYNVFLNSLLQTWIFLLLGTVVIISIVRKKLNIKLASALILIIIIIDLFINGFSLNPRLSSKFYQSKSESVKYLEQDKSFYRMMVCLEGSERFFLFGDTFEEAMKNAKLILYPNQNIEYKIYCANGYDSINVKRYNDFVNTIMEKPKVRYLSLINTKYLFTNKDLETSLLKLVKDFKVVKIYKNGILLPHCYFIQKVRLVNSEKDAMNYIFSNEFDPKKEVVIEGLNEFKLDSNKEIFNEISIEDYKSDIIRIKADLSNDGVIVLNDTYYPGWKVYVDGKEGKIYPANYIYRGIYVSGGNHKIEFIFKPVTFIIGSIITLISFFAVLIIFVFLYKKQYAKD